MSQENIRREDSGRGAAGLPTGRMCSNFQIDVVRRAPRLKTDRTFGDFQRDDEHNQKASRGASKRRSNQNIRRAGVSRSAQGSEDGEI